MCHYVTAILPPNVSLASLGPTATSTAQADTDLARWEGFLAALLESGVAYVGLVLHDSEGPVDAGVALTGRQIVALGPETPPGTVLASMRDDCRYDFRVHRDRAVAASARATDASSRRPPVR